MRATKLTRLLTTITKKKLQQASRNKVFSFDNYRYLNYIIDCWYRVPLLRGHLLKMDTTSKRSPTWGNRPAFGVGVNTV